MNNILLKYLINGFLTNFLKVILFFFCFGIILNLFEGFQSAGNKSFSWDGTNQSGQKVTTGIYIYRLDVNGVAYNKKMIFIK